MSTVLNNMQQLHSHWKDMQSKNIQSQTSKKRRREDDNIRTNKPKKEIQNRKIVQIIKK